MLKQKFIPMMSTALLLFSCGNKITIKINVPKNYRGHNCTLISEATNLKNGQEVVFDITLDNLPKNEEDEGRHSFVLSTQYRDDNIDSESMLYCFSKTTITCNDKVIEDKGEYSLEEEYKFWDEETINKNPSFDNTFIIKDFIYPDAGLNTQEIHIAHYEIVAGDRIQIHTTCTKDTVAIGIFSANYEIVQ